jgi:hypothetical protein
VATLPRTPGSERPKKRAAYQPGREWENPLAEAYSEVDLQLRVPEGWLELFIADDGMGFDQGHTGYGQGLASMRRRSEHLGGTLVMESPPGHATKVHLRVPLTRPTRPFGKSYPHTWVVDSRLSFAGTPSAKLSNLHACVVTAPRARCVIV